MDSCGKIISVKLRIAHVCTKLQNPQIGTGSQQETLPENAEMQFRALLGNDIVNDAGLAKKEGMTQHAIPVRSDSHAPFHLPQF